MRLISPPSCLRSMPTSCTKKKKVAPPSENTSGMSVLFQNTPVHKRSRKIRQLHISVIFRPEVTRFYRSTPCSPRSTASLFSAAPDAQWRTYAGDGHSGQHKKGLVGVPAGARLEGYHLLANRREEMRLPRLRGKNAFCVTLSILKRSFST